MTTKREWVLKAFKNETVDKVPVGKKYLWHSIKYLEYTTIEEFFIIPL
ncbi:hypothetical protein [Streptococcus infantarius]|nr:hypothetical protein [Streptococcus infantarius]